MGQSVTVANASGEKVYVKVDSSVEFLIRTITGPYIVEVRISCEFPWVWESHENCNLWAKVLGIRMGVGLSQWEWEEMGIILFS